MGFVVLPALVTDISAVYDVYFAAFKGNVVTQALFPNVSVVEMLDPSSDFRKAHTAHTLEYWAKDKTQYTVKCVDIDTGAIVGMALWDIYLTPSQWRRGELTWLQGQEKKHAETLISPLWETREQLWLDERYVYCHVVAVHPDYQRKGIGQLLLEHGISIAKQTSLPIFIESSKDGKRLYEKMGCKRLSTKPRHADEDEGVDLFVWTSQEGKENLPRAVEVYL